MSLELLLSHVRRTAALDQARLLLDWDQEAMMPPAGAGQRAEQAGALAAVIHERNSDPRIPDWAGAIDRAALTPLDAATVREAERAHRLATRIPARLAEESAKAASAGGHIWADARKRKDFSAFAPALAHIIALRREEAACLAEGDGPEAQYDALLDQYEPGMKTAELAPMLEGMRPRLVALREKIAGKPAPARPKGPFGADVQMKLARAAAERLGYDFSAGRLDLVNHPFSSGAGQDVRITTRIDEANIFDCLYTTLHEVGHALYSKGSPDPFRPGAEYSSMGVHESQSRFWENQIGRSAPAAEWLFPLMKEIAGDGGLSSARDYYRAANLVEPGFIRTEADEVHYNLHILLRFELERELISGALETEALESEWNKRFARDFGETPPDASLGVLQDIHWSGGEFGYFPTYALGNIYAACLDKAMRRDMPGRDEMLRAGEHGPVLAWHRERIHQKGRTLPAPALIAEATGETPSSGPLLDYLEAKFGELYEL